MKRPGVRQGRIPVQLGAAAGLALIAGAAGILWWQSRTAHVGPVATAAEQNYKRGLSLAESENNRGAEEAFLTAIALKPGYAPAHFALADLYDSANRPALAAEKLKALLVADPRARHVQCRRAELYLKADGFEKVVQTARAELEQDSQCSLANSVLGMALSLAGDADGAIAHLTLARAAKPQDEAISRTLAQLLGQTGHPEEGLAIARPMLQGDKTPPEVEYLVGWLQMKSAPSDAKVQKEAVQRLTRAVSLAPDYPAANGVLVALLVRMNLPSDGIKFLERAQKSGSLDEEMANALAKAATELKRPDAPSVQAFAKQTAEFNARIKKLRAVWLTHPDNVKNTVELASMEAQRGDLPDARDLVYGVLKEDPNQPGALKLLEEFVARK